MSKFIQNLLKRADRFQSPAQEVIADSPAQEIPEQDVLATEQEVLADSPAQQALGTSYVRSLLAGNAFPIYTQEHLRDFEQRFLSAWSDIQSPVRIQEALDRLPMELLAATNTIWEPDASMSTAYREGEWKVKRPPIGLRLYQEASTEVDRILGYENKVNLYSSFLSGPSMRGLDPLQPDRTVEPSGLLKETMPATRLVYLDMMNSPFIRDYMDEYERVSPELKRVIQGVQDVEVVNRVTPFTYLHEYTHGVMFPLSTITYSNLQRHLSGELGMTDIVTRSYMNYAMIQEAVADAIGAALSGDLEGALTMRYSAEMAVHAGDDVKPRYGDPIRLEVIDPALIEDTENSPLWQMVRQAASDIEQRRPNKFIDEPNVMRYSLERRDLRAFTNAMQSLEHITSMVYDKLISAAESGSLDRQLRETIMGQASRIWIYPYFIGKARPDLIGKEINILPESIEVAETGEKLNLAEILPDIAPLGLIDESVVHPEHLRRSFKLIELYDRARERLRAERAMQQASEAEVVHHRNYETAPPPDTGEAVIERWREWIRSIAP
ncbi:MAG: hypothetical protein KatS3mg023_3940 [Armatimonadota bacterium]|nr:MAG: hypothetical protein KatS3mg023_3940 [Armatimonadota bacterium]